MNMISLTRKKTAILAAVMLTLSACGSPRADTSIGATGNFSPFVDAEGNISRPTKFLNDPDWMHIGSWAVVNDTGEDNGVHNVYTTRDVVAAFKRDGVFPDGAVLVKEVTGAVADNLTTGRAHWAGEHLVWFVMVKDQTNRFPDNPLWGDGWGWALFKADAPNIQVATEYKQDCLGCHIPVENTDWIYMQGYPVLVKQ